MRYGVPDHASLHNAYPLRPFTTVTRGRGATGTMGIIAKFKGKGNKKRRVLHIFHEKISRRL